MKTISGMIESQRKDKTAIKINGMWLQFPKEATKEQMDRVKWKDWIEVTYDDGTKGNPIIQHIKMLGKSDAKPEFAPIEDKPITSAETIKQPIETIDTIPKEVRAMKDATALVIDMFNLSGIDELTDGYLGIINTLIKYKLWNEKSF